MNLECIFIAVATFECDSQITRILIRFGLGNAEFVFCSGCDFTMSCMCLAKIFSNQLYCMQLIQVEIKGKRVLLLCLEFLLFHEKTVRGR
jgi:hypothetical protein